MKKIRFSLLTALLFFIPVPAEAQFRVLETDDLRLIYLDLASDYLVKYMAGAFHNSLDVYHDMFDYEPSEPVTMFVHDLGDYGNAGADAVPRNIINIGMAPLNYSFETAPANERMNSIIHHELIHVLANDQAAGSDKFFRAIFGGKVSVSDNDPVTILYSFLTNPRRYAPRWYQEGIAVFMETWMSGGWGRSMGGYDEMVFRTRVLENARFFDMVGLESEGTSDFQVGVNSYLYGTRFMSYLAHEYSPEQVREWMSRPHQSKGHFTSQFKAVFGLPIGDAWDNWITFEHKFQAENLERIRQYPVTSYREISARPLGSMSKAYVDPLTGELLAAVNYPGTLSHITGIDLNSGREHKLANVSGPALFNVSSVTFDEQGRRLFYSTNNNRWRDLMMLDLSTGDKTQLMKAERIGDLVYNKRDSSLWGVRHFLGLSTIVRIPPPYTRWNQMVALDYGYDIYDIDISPDGEWLTGAYVEVTGQQKLIRARTVDLIDHNFEFETLFGFDQSNPEGFVWGPDGEALYGSSYYSGVSNILRYDFSDSTLYALTNGETGYFRPIPMEGDSLIAFRYTSKGFQPVMIKDAPVLASKTHFLGVDVREKHPVLFDWEAPPPNRIDIDSLGYRDVPYLSASSIELESVHPVVHGYKDEVAVGLKLNLSDPLGMHRISATASVTPVASSDSTARLPEDELLHLGLDYRYRNWNFSASLNRSDFYDLFGPTKRSRKGYAVGLTYKKMIAYEGPRKNLSYEIGAAGYFDLEKLPSFQEIDATFTELGQGYASLTYKNLRSSLGSVDSESGFIWSVDASSNYVNDTLYPRTSASLDFGTLLPIPHLSFWLRTSAGISAGNADNPFANYYFGGFRNNWVDKREAKQYNTQPAFPGLKIDRVGGTNYAKVAAELILPPIRIRHVGGPMLYLKWFRVSIFTMALWTNLQNDFIADDPGSRGEAYNVGGQIDLRIMFFSYLRSTLSFGYAAAKEKDGKTQYETMVSLKIL